MTVKRVVTIPDAHHVVRYVPISRQARDPDTGELVGNGLLGLSLQQKTAEQYVSVNWLEFHDGSRDERLDLTRRDLATAFPPKAGSKALLAIGNVGEVKRICVSRKKPVRITHEPRAHNPAHAGIRQLPRQEDELLALLVTEVFLETVAMVPPDIT